LRFTNFSIGQIAARHSMRNNALMVDSWTIRRAAESDRSAAATVHVRAWQLAYRGIISDASLDALNVASRVDRYPFDLPESSDLKSLVACKDDVLGGWVILGPSRDGDDAKFGEIWALNVDPDYWRSGAGSLLMAGAEELLAVAGFAEAILWVLVDNVRGRHFYEAVGWRPDGENRTIASGGNDLVEVRYQKA
jgi:ribosomal protein S18 acetylase RimI-like enzyme